MATIEMKSDFHDVYNVPVNKKLAQVLNDATDAIFKRKTQAGETVTVHFDITMIVVQENPE
jgi:hypothetical protein